MYPFTLLHMEQCFSSSLVIKLTTELTIFHKDTSTVLKAARIIADTTSIHLLLKLVQLHGIINSAYGFSQKPTSYEIFSFLSDFDMFKPFTTILLCQTPLEFILYGMSKFTWRYKCCR